MIKTFALFILLALFFSLSAFSQVPAKKWIDSKTLNKIFKTQFSNLVNGQSSSKGGTNFASVDITKAQLSFNGFIDFTNSNLSINVNGAVTDGFAALFTNSKLNTNVGTELKYNMMLPFNSVTYTTLSLEKRDEALNFASLAYDLSLKNIPNDSTLLETQISLLKIRIKKIGCEKPKSKQARLEKTAALVMAVKTLDSLVYARQLMTTNLKDIRSKLKKEYTRRADSIKLNAPDITAFSLRWIALVGNIQNKAFRLFDPTQPFAQQVTKSNYTSKTAGVEFNLYKWDERNYRTYYLDFGISGSIDNNLDNLSTIDLSEKTNYTTVTDQRTSSKTYSVYTGTYQSGIKKMRFYSELYWFLFPQNLAALHVFPEAVVQETQKPAYNIGTGFLFGFKDKKDKDGKSIINVELYYKFLDVSNSLASSLSLLQRNEVGLRFGLPINTYSKK